MAAPAAARMAAIKRMVFKIPKMEKPELSSVSGSAFKAGSPAGSPVMEPEPLKTSSSSAPSADPAAVSPSLLRLLEGSPEEFSAGLPEEFPEIVPVSGT